MRNSRWGIVLKVISSFGCDSINLLTLCIICSNFRGFLARKRQIEQNLQAYTPSSRDLEWARKYKQDLKKREGARKQKNQYAIFM